jgi:hypothetical protein
METRLARIISYIFHPLLIPTYSFLLLLNMKAYFSMIIPGSAKWLIISLIFITTFLFPSLFVLFFYRRKLISSVQMESKEDRTLPYVVTVIFFYVTYYLLKRLQISPIFYYYMAGATFLVISTLIINLFWKISGHMVSVGALLGAVIALSIILGINLTPALLITILLSGLVGSARLKVGSHNPPQIYTGFFLGLIVMGGLFIFF